MPQDQIVFYFFIAVIGLFVLAVLSKLFKRSSRKKIFSSMAARHGWSFTEKIEVSPFQAVGQVFAGSFKRAAEQRRLSKKVGVEKKEAQQLASQAERQALALRNAPPGSILADPDFYHVQKTDGIFNYCSGQYSGFGVELFDELQISRVRRSSGDRRRLESTNTDLVLELKQAGMPGFQISMMSGSKIGSHPNRVHMHKLPGFDDKLAVVPDAGEPALRDRIERLLSADALKALMDLWPVQVRAKGRYVQFSRRIPELNDKELDHLLEQGLQFVKHLNIG
jgi:hypothetical protein